MNGLSSSCVLATTTVLSATSPLVRRLASGGLVQLVPLPTGATWVRVSASSTPRLIIGVDTVLLCAAESRSLDWFFGEDASTVIIWGIIEKMKDNEEIVGRAELKLKGAVEAFSYDLRGKTVLDIGSSTGGFTEYALVRGAERVIAIEKGTRQMKAPLRFDSRVELHEKMDFFDVIGVNKEGELVTKQGKNTGELVTALQVQTVLADVSFVSLKKILVHAKKIVSKKADFLVMLKPQFEARLDQLNRGAVKNERMRREIIRDFEQWLVRNGFMIVKKRDNETVGKVGKNQERFYLLRLSLAKY